MNGIVVVSYFPLDTAIGLYENTLNNLDKNCPSFYSFCLSYIEKSGYDTSN